MQKSRFIGICRRVREDAEAAEILAQIRRKYRDATHVCHAYLSGESARSSDDGEPSGTAGVPIMESIRAAGLQQTLVAVVRYFGGIKLGTGGLGRAYAHTASEVLRAANKTEVAECTVLRVSLEYSVYKKIEKRQVQSLYKSMGLEYNKTVDLTVAVREEAQFIAEMTSLTQGKFSVVSEGICLVERSVKI